LGYGPGILPEFGFSYFPWIPNVSSLVISEKALDILVFFALIARQEKKEY
jgi:hypothetical protein